MFASTVSFGVLNTKQMQALLMTLWTQQMMWVLSAYLWLHQYQSGELKIRLFNFPYGNTGELLSSSSFTVGSGWRDAEQGNVEARKWDEQPRRTRVVSQAGDLVTAWIFSDSLDILWYRLQHPQWCSSSSIYFQQALHENLSYVHWPRILTACDLQVAFCQLLVLNSLRNELSCLLYVQLSLGLPQPLVSHTFR